MSLRWSARAVRGRLLDAGRRRQRGALRDAQPQPDERRRRAHVDENRRRLCAAVGADDGRLALNRQVHSATVHRAKAGARGTPGDGLWTDEPGQPMLAMAADCLTIALARTNGDRPASPSSTRAGAACSTGSPGPPSRRSGTVEPAAVGPAIGPCCYEVGDEVAGPYREAFGADVVGGRKLDLWTAAERALRAAGVRRVERVDVCTHCNPELFFSQRRTGRPRGTHGVIGHVA